MNGFSGLHPKHKICQQQRNQERSNHANRKKAARIKHNDALFLSDQAK